MIEISDSRLIHLKGDRTSYIINVLKSGQAEHFYYAKRLENITESEKAISEKNFSKSPSAISYSEEYPTLDLNSISLEASTEGKGDYKSPLVKIRGKRTLDFKVREIKKYQGVKKYNKSTLPQALKEKDAESVEILLEDKSEKISLILCYTIFEKEDVIARRTIIRNDGDEEIVIEKAASLQLDLPSMEYELITLQGAYLRENNVIKEKLSSGKRELSSVSMATGFNQNNTFSILSNRGECYILSLLYSSDFKTSIETLEDGKLHIVSGINEETFSWPLKKGEEFESPEAIITYSEKGLNDASDNFKEAVRSLIMRSNWKNRVRPALFSTRALGLDINEDKILSLAKKASDLGFETFILDDGWFGVRRDDTESLGDWYVNPMKFPQGLKMLATNIHRMGLLFGLYFDIETVSIRSNLYQKHKDWVLNDGKKRDYSSRGDDFILDFGRNDVQEWAIKTLSDIIETTRLDYLRYDKSRLPSEISFENGTLSHKYIMGVYNVLNTIREKYPSIIIETSFNGPGRFDLAMLAYSSIIRATENTDAISRLSSIEGLRLFYPEYASLVTVAESPDKYTFRSTPLESKFNSSVFTAFEYSMDLNKLNELEEKEIREELEFYKMYREAIQFGTIRTEESSDRVIWSAASKDRETIIVLYLLKRCSVNRIKERLYVRDAKEDYKYRIYTRGHVQSESEELAYPLEIECYDAYGDALKWAGLALSDKSGVGFFTENMRKMEDYSSRLYIIRKVK